VLLDQPSDQVRVTGGERVARRVVGHAVLLVPDRRASVRFVLENVRKYIDKPQIEG
jgi:hypothetical protein